MRWLRQLRCPLVLVLLHTALVLLIGVVVWTSRDTETVLLWLLFERIDWPAAASLFPLRGRALSIFLGLLIWGGLQWLLIGLVLQGLLEACIWMVRGCQRILR